MMKNTVLLVTLLLAFISCDKVEHPIVPKYTPPPIVGVDTVYHRNSNISKAGYRKILFEDYTGHTCPNCPAGTRVLKNNLIPKFKDTLVVLAIHQGITFAAPVPPKFPNDFRTEAGEAWAALSGFAVNFYPAGIINRKKYASSLTLPYAAWSTNVPKAKVEPFLLRLDVSTEYEQKSRGIKIKVKGTALQALNNNVKIIIGLVQDSIVGPQVDGSKDVEEYEFEHIFRGALNGSWGEMFMPAPVASGNIVDKSFPLIEIPASVNSIPLLDLHASIVVIAYDETTKECLQAEVVKIRK